MSLRLLAIAEAQQHQRPGEEIAGPSLCLLRKPSPQVCVGMRRMTLRLFAAFIACLSPAAGFTAVA